MGIITTEYKGSPSDNAGVAELDGGIDALPLLATKFYRPPVTPLLEQRSLLIERLERSRQRPLTLILAPAGYGKTTLASMWLESCGCANAWLSLDEGENDLHTFVSYLLAAVSGAFPTLELKTQSLLAAPNLPSAPVLAHYLLNDLDQLQEPLILALDNVQMITEQTVFELVNQLLRHPSPYLHLALIGRHTPPLPIASLRAHGQVTEVRAIDLRFTPQETAGLLGRMLDREIDEAVAEDCTEKTEGWVTALRLVGISLRHRDQTQGLHASIEGDNRYLREYLLAEVMAHLPAAHQGWLLKTAILDRFCAPLCEAVCQAGTECAETGLDGEEFIQWLERESLFLVPLDVRSEWFRFHHLFQQLLQDRLQKHVAPREIAAAHLRASNWFAEQGLVEEALQHALAAGEVQTAVHLVEEHRYHLMNTEQWHRLERWLKLLPEDAVAQSPLLTNTKAFLGLFRGQDREIAIGPQEAKRLMATQSLDSAMVQLVQAETAVSQGVLDIIAGQPAGAVAGAQKSLELLPAQALYIRSVAVAIVGVGLQMRGELEQGVAVIREALADPTWPAAIRARSGLYLSVAHLQEGDLPGVLRSASEFLVLAEQLQLGESRSHCRCHLGIAHYLRNELSQAEPYLLALLEDRAQSAPTYVTVGAFALVLLYHAQNRVSEAEQVIDLVRAYVETVQNTFSWAIMRAMAIELALRRGKLTEAQRMSPSVDFDLRPPSWLFYVPQLTPIKLLLAEGTRQGLKEARARLEAMDGKMRQIHRNNVRIDVLALQALVGDAQGDEVTALQKLRAALDLGSIGGNIRTFVDLGAPMAELLRRLRKQGTGKRFDQSFVRYVDLILSAFPEKTVEAAQARVSSQPEPHPPSSTLVEPLTDREYQTLRLLATDLSTEEIAAELFVTKATVYSYSKRIYSKLVAHSRFEAVQRAEALGLL